MTQAHIAVLLDESKLSVEEFILSCAVDNAWLLEHVQAGVLSPEPGAEPETWRFSGADLKRGRRLRELERTFDACPELAGLVVDLLDEVERVRSRLRRAGIPAD
jgi:chaperone modulatory protein CbpM